MTQGWFIRVVFGAVIIIGGSKALLAQGTKDDPYEQLSRSLPKDTVYIEFFEYGLPDSNPLVAGGGGPRIAASAYAALVLRGNHPIERVELRLEGRATLSGDVTKAVERWRKDIIEGKDDGPTGHAQQLRELVWQSIAPHIPPETKTVYMVPHGILAWLPWPALPVSDRGLMLLEKYSLAIVPDFRVLLGRFAAQPTPSNDKSGLLLAVGGIEYAKRPAPFSGRVMISAIVHHLPDVERLRGSFPVLPRSGEELDRLLPMVRPRPVCLLRGTVGAEEMLLSLTRARWAVLATHAFFIDDPATLVGPDASLRLSGLAMAGANRDPEPGPRGAPSDDGIVTSDVIAGLTLGRLDLVVISSCQSGRGRITEKGVYGLQRAFHTAGARNVVAALWDVEDFQTSALMGLFHQLLWREGKSPMDALRLAQLYIYRHEEMISELADSRGQIFDEAVRDAAKEALKYEHQGWERPCYRSKTSSWAGFILSGPGR